MSQMGIRHEYCLSTYLVDIIVGQYNFSEQYCRNSERLEPATAVTAATSLSKLISLAGLSAGRSRSDNSVGYGQYSIYVKAKSFVDFVPRDISSNY